MSDITDTNYRVENLRYIVLLLESKYKDHDGKVFIDLSEAREWCKDVIEEKYADKIVIGMFVNHNTRQMNISLVETYGFAGDKKDPHQLKLFETFKNETNAEANRK